MKYLIIKFSLTFSIFTAFCQEDSNITSLLKLNKKFNVIQFSSDSTAKKLILKFQSTNKKRVSIIHFGDSHIQGEYSTSIVRKKLQEKYGDAGKGMMFSYSAANSYNSMLYRTSHSKTWTYAKNFQQRPKLPLGISGMTVKTTNNGAQLKFHLNQSTKNSEIIKLFISKNPQSFDLKVSTEDTTHFIKINENLDSTISYIPILIPKNQKTITLETIQSNYTQTNLEFYGLSLENKSNSGIIYHAVGVGASQFGSLLSETLFDAQLKDIHVDLAILDFGTNDYVYANKIPSDLPRKIELIIKNIRLINPSTTILLTSTQDLFYKSQPISEGIKFRNLIDSLAKKNNCLFWDWYAISGGYKSLTSWRDNGYAQRDLIHLTTKGYQLKGELLFEAIERMIDTMTQSPSLKQLSIPYLENKSIFETITFKQSIIEPENKEKITKTIEENKEENKEKITKKTIEKNQENSQEDNLVFGESIALQKKKNELKIVINDSIKPKKKTIKPIYYKIHTVKSGETLSEIANKHRTTVEYLKKLNRIKSDRLSIGQKLNY